MNLIACVDDRGGIAFNHRRQSSDSVVRDRILELTAGSRLWMNEYSAKQFDVDAMPQINISGEFLNEAVPGDYCLVEDVSVATYEKWVEQIILFKWNRVYPQDRAFDIDLTQNRWKLQSTEDFPGHSHENVTMEVYVR